LTERLGMVPARTAEAAKPGSVWIHAVSVGEVLAISQLLRQFQQAAGETPIFVSTTTVTGQYLARGRFGENKAFFLPIDFGFAIRPYLNRLQPGLLVLAETEFWPNLLHLAKKRGTAIVVVNARVSDRSFPRYRRFRWFFSRLLSNIDLFLAQSEDDARRLVAIGAPAERVQVSGNLKFDVPPSAAGALINDLRKAIPRIAPIIVCGSTADGEEIVLLNAFHDVLGQHPSAVMVLAPRHPERFDKVAGLISALKLPLVRRTSWNASRPVSCGVFLLDSVGELASVYALADIAFVGGSLLPVGGHNILEPAQHGVAIVTGPHTFNFREIVRIFTENDALRIVEPENISQQFLELLQDEPTRKSLGNRARELFTRYSGATQKTLQALYPLLKK
jgi:3-deoxy-D-manno-octulosonic-acid transferase